VNTDHGSRGRWPSIGEACVWRANVPASRSRALSGILATLCLVGLAGSVRADFFVSPDGDDGNPGTKEKPFATLVRARDAVRGMKAEQPARDYRVLLRGGVHRFRETIVFSRQDGSQDGHTTTYAAYPGETPVLSSGIPVTGWEDLRAPLPGLPAKARGKVWSAPVPAGLSTFHTLFEGNQRLPRARSRGFRPSDRARSWRGREQSVVSFPKGVLRDRPDLAGQELVIITAAPWTMNILPLRSVNEASLTAQTAIPGTYLLTQPRFGHFPASAWIENAIEGLDEPGEWVLDARTNRIILWPRGDSPGNDIVAPALTEMIRIEGEIDYEGPKDAPVRGIVLQGLTFTQTDRFTWEKDRVGWGLQHDWEMFDRSTATIRMRGAENCSVLNCRFTNSGATGIRLDLHAQKNTISGNEIHHVGGVGILLCGYGPGTKDVNRENTVTRNHIHHIGETYWHSPGIFVWQSGSNTIGNNLLHHLPYSGVAVTGRIVWDRRGRNECSKTIRWKEVDRLLGPRGQPNWYGRERFLHGRENRIVRNEIHHVVEIMTDGNGIYISGAGRNNVVSENYVHDCPNQQFAEGIRCDDDQHETTIERNLIWRLGGLATYVAIKGKNHVKNNIFASPLTRPRRGMLSLELTRGLSLEGTEIRNNIFYSSNAQDRICFQGNNYPGTPSKLRDATTDHNLYFNATDPGWGKRHVDAERRHGSEIHSSVDDPGFVDPAKGDFRLKPNSPALKLGFVPIDMSKIGLN
jgi:parallel beta-helix repeat protein